MLRCSKLSCGLEYQLNDDGVWRLWVAAAAEVEHTHSSRAPTPAPAVAHMLGSGSGDEGGGAGADSGDGGSDGAGDDEGDGGEERAEDGGEEEENDTVFVMITAQQVKYVFGGLGVRLVWCDPFLSLPLSLFRVEFDRLVALSPWEVVGVLVVRDPKHLTRKAKRKFACGR